MTRTERRPSLALIGAGHMGDALLQGWLKADAIDWSRCAIVHRGAKGLGLTGAEESGAQRVDGFDNPGDVAVLAVKPQDAAPALERLQQAIGPETHVVSVAAGLRLEDLRERVAGAATVSRAMPNLPTAFGKGVTALCGESGAGVPAMVITLFEAVGVTIELGLEDDIDAATALAGSGPAYVYRFVEALSRAGTRLGLTPQQSARAALGVLDGAATVLAQGFDPAAARAAVTSKGGTTAAGLSVMDEDDAIDTLMYHTLQAAAERAGGLAQALRTPDTSEEGSA